MTQFARPMPAAPDYDSTIIGALELSEKKWVLAVQLPGVKRHTRHVLGASGEELALLIERLKVCGHYRTDKLRITAHVGGRPSIIPSSRTALPPPGALTRPLLLSLRTHAGDRARLAIMHHDRYQRSHYPTLAFSMASFAPASVARKTSGHARDRQTFSKATRDGTQFATANKAGHHIK
jgi:hypothetical protein